MEHRKYQMTLVTTSGHLRLIVRVRIIVMYEANMLIGANFYVVWIFFLLFVS